jgi:hypothetical protein
MTKIQKSILKFLAGNKGSTEKAIMGSVGHKFVRMELQALYQRGYVYMDDVPVLPCTYGLTLLGEEYVRSQD